MVDARIKARLHFQPWRQVWSLKIACLKILTFFFLTGHDFYLFVYFFLKMPLCISKEKSKVQSQFVMLGKDAVVRFRTNPCQWGGKEAKRRLLKNAGPGHVTWKQNSMWNGRDF